jgi:tetratricopeptide (TPR) repeat protein
MKKHLIYLLTFLLLGFLYTLSVYAQAYDYYQRGEEEFRNGEIERAEDLYYKALEYDSTFAQAYIGLAYVYWSKHSGDLFSENFMDSVLILADIALSYDDQLAEAYNVKGYYYYSWSLITKASEEYDKAIKYNPNDWMAYRMKGGLYEYYDLVKAIDNYHKAASLNRGPQLPGLLRQLGNLYRSAGFTEKANYYSQEALKLDDDSASYYSDLGNSERGLRNYEKAVEFLKKGYAIDSNNNVILRTLGSCYMFLGQYEESLKYFVKWFEPRKARGLMTSFRLNWLGYVYLQNGYKEEAEYYFNEAINENSRMIELGRFLNNTTYYYLAGVYAFRGEKDKAYENLNIINQSQSMRLFMVTWFKDDPLFNSIRDEPEFQKIVRDVEAKYQAEHERVRQWLEENDML